MNIEFVAYGQTIAPSGVHLDRGIRFRGLGDLPNPTGGATGSARRATPGSAS